MVVVSRTCYVLPINVRSFLDAEIWKRKKMRKYMTTRITTRTATCQICPISKRTQGSHIIQLLLRREKEWNQSPLHHLSPSLNLGWVHLVFRIAPPPPSFPQKYHSTCFLPFEKERHHSQEICVSSAGYEPNFSSLFSRDFDLFNLRHRDKKDWGLQYF